jgi:DNA-directed RNA polymerase II subunit RPB4
LQFGEFADGEALTLTDVQALLLHARSVPGAPPPPDNKYVGQAVQAVLTNLLLKADTRVYKLTTEYVGEFSNSTPELMSSMRT